MSIRTESEILFEKFCRETGIPFTPISPEPRAGRRTPDYELHVQEPAILAEVKQIDSNPEDKELLRRLQENGSYEFQGLPGKRVRRKIRDAASQLKARAKPGQPTLLVVYNNVDVLRVFTGPDSMMSAMYGVHEVVFTTICDPAGRQRRVSRRLGRNRQLTPQHNTTISAVAVLFEGPEGPYLVVYHNRFASNPIPPKVLRSPRIYQYRIRDVDPRDFPEWAAV